MEPLYNGHFGTRKIVCYMEVSTIKRLVTCIAIYLDPQKQSVMERFLLLGEFVVRGSMHIIKLSYYNNNIIIIVS